MSSKIAIMNFSALALLLLILSFSCNAMAKNKQERLIFTGDILLSREVIKEINSKHGQSPWTNVHDYFQHADLIMGNFEGSVGDKSKCVGKNLSLCFAVQPNYLAYIKQAGFTIVGIENNHIADLGVEGRKNTRSLFAEIGIPALDFAHSPGFFKVREHIIAIITLSNIADKSGMKVEVPSNELRQKIRLAKSLSDWVIINIHWGAELADWPDSYQRAIATWMIKQGADVIIGHHPHVVQEPECIMGHPVFFSLGNHVFDQKYPDTKHGLIAECQISADQLFCFGVKTKTPNNTAFPEISPRQTRIKQAIEYCRVAKNKTLIIDQYHIRPRLLSRQFVDGDIVLEGRKDSLSHWTVVARHLLSLSKAQFLTRHTKESYLFTLENHISDMDQEESPRPYVYKVTPQGLIAKWRGSALAWPLVDAALIRAADNIDYLCALHRKDSFITLNPLTKETRVALYTWNGFGFSGVEDKNLIKKCSLLFNHEGF